KMVDEKLEIGEIRLLQKTGGKSDFKDRFASTLKAAVLVMSDSIAQGKKEDVSGKLIVERLQLHGVEIGDYKIVEDSKQVIIDTIKDYADVRKFDLVITTGGTGLSPRDTTPEAMAELFEREAPGIAEAARVFGQEKTPYAMLSRGKAGVRGK